MLFMGMHVISGSAKALVVHTGVDTKLGRISQRIAGRHPDTDFDRGVRRFGFLLAEITLVIVVIIFALNVYLDRPVLNSLLFALALAVGLTPQFLPAIISVNLSRGARRMAERKVIVKRLAAIENFGTMDVLCSDKTGTLTEGKAHIRAAVGIDGRPSDKVLRFAWLNASFESGYSNPVDEAIREHASFPAGDVEKLGELPYDFVRKRLSILLNTGDERVLITKGAFQNVIGVCSRVEGSDREEEPIEKAREGIQRYYEECGRKGWRVLGIACRTFPEGLSLSRDAESGMTFLGFIVIEDPPKGGVGETIKRMAGNGIRLKMISGDNRLVAAHVAGEVGLSGVHALTGGDIRKMSDEALVRVSDRVDVFAEVEPNQKERIILALKKAGRVVGYMGDGINDASALHAADVGISVDTAVDVAKEAADFVLLEKDLNVLVDAVREGRRTFANTLKYVFMATSANFGNKFSMAGASLLLPFLPLLPKQVLLANLMTDLPEMTIAGDSVDDDQVEKPQRWNIGFIRRFMLCFGILSSLFDYMTFGVLMRLKATPEQFRSGWFLESVISACLVVLVVRTRKSMFKSRPGKYLVLATIGVVLAMLAVPFTPLMGIFEFGPLPPAFLAAMVLIVVAYILSAEGMKKWFYRRWGR